MKNFWNTLTDDQKLELLIIYDEKGSTPAAWAASKLYKDLTGSLRGWSVVSFWQVIREAYENMGMSKPPIYSHIF